MTKLGLNVPPGCTLSVQTCKAFLDDASVLRDLEPLIFSAVDLIAEEQSEVFYHKATDFVGVELPLLLSVRSGAEASMPGMMDTILNLGLNDSVVETLIQTSFKSEVPRRFLFDAYRRLLDLFGDVVFSIPHQEFEKKLEKLKELKGAANDNDLDADALESLCQSYKDVYRSHGKEFPMDPSTQLILTIEAVFKSWNNPRAQVYREVTKTAGLEGTAVNIQAMVYGNLNEHSLSGVCFTRSPATGENLIYGEWLRQSQGEDVVAGIRTPEMIQEMPKFGFEKQFVELQSACKVLEKSYLNMMDVEFTVEDNVLYILQCRVGKRTGMAALNIAADLVEEDKLLTAREAISYVDVSHIEQVLHPTFRSSSVIGDGSASHWNVLATGLAASPGCASGRICFSSADAIDMHNRGEKVILVREETSAEDVGGMHVSEGFLTQRGGMTSHAAVVARGWGRPCIAGTKSMHITDHEHQIVHHDELEGSKTVIERSVSFDSSPELSFKKGDWISIDGTRGQIIEGERELEPIDNALQENKALADFMLWVDEIPSLTKVYANCDTEKEIRMAMNIFGAVGVGLVRVEHMFLASPDRVRLVRELFLAKDEAQRERALVSIEPILREDFASLMKAVGHDKPLTIRLLDPPVHEFLPTERELADEDILAEIKDYCGQITEAELRKRIAALKEQNPMLGNRGCRLGISHPEITAMTVRAIANAYYDVHETTGDAAIVKIMVPLVSSVSEYLHQAHVIDRAMYRTYMDRRCTLKFSKEHFGPRLGKDICCDYKPFQIGAMLETPRACLIANELATNDSVGCAENPLRASFFSFGTNDLTQMTFGYSRDDSSFFLAYEKEKLALEDPFQTLDEGGVGKLIQYALETLDAAELKTHQPDVSVCGEHAANEKSIKFFVQNDIKVVSCSPYRVLGARLAVAKAELAKKKTSNRSRQ